MKPILMIVASCAALLCAQLAEAGGGSLEAGVVFLQPNAYSLVFAEVVAKPQAAVVSYREGTRRLRLGERLRARIRAHRAIRKLRVQTVEAVVEPVTLGVESRGCKR